MSGDGPLIYSSQAANPDNAQTVIRDSVAQGYGTLMSEVYALLERAAPSVGLGLWVREYLVLCLNCSLCDLPV